MIKGNFILLYKGLNVAFNIESPVVLLEFLEFLTTSQYEALWIDSINALCDILYWVPQYQLIWRSLGQFRILFTVN